jgi:hypothetical protein
VSDRVLALDRGRKVTEGSAADVLAHPAVVASYLGSNDAAIQRSGARAGSAPITMHQPSHHNDRPPGPAPGAGPEENRDATSE